jgi:hypothetical protein
VKTKTANEKQTISMTLLCARLGSSLLARRGVTDSGRALVSPNRVCVIGQLQSVSLAGRAANCSADFTATRRILRKGIPQAEGLGIGAKGIFRAK